MITKEAAQKAYQAGVQQALCDAGLIKSAFNIEAPLLHAALGSGVGAGAGALAGKYLDPQERVGKGALIGALTGAGAGAGTGLARGKWGKAIPSEIAAYLPGAIKDPAQANALAEMIRNGLIGGAGGGALGLGTAALLPEENPSLASRLLGR